MILNFPICSMVKLTILVNFKLPTERKQSELTSPRSLLIIAHTKTGKTSNLAELDDNLIIDFEDGSAYANGMCVNVRKEAASEGVSELEFIKILSDKIKESGKQYNYITLDTATSMEELAKILALMQYKNSEQGAKYTGDTVEAIPFGLGYALTANCFFKIYNLFKDLPVKGIIITAHPKKSSVKKEGNELDITDLDLGGKLKQIICKEVDAIGILYRDKNTNLLSFKQDEANIVAGTRVKRLRNKEVVLSKMVDDKLETFWNEIFE